LRGTKKPVSIGWCAFHGNRRGCGVWRWWRDPTVNPSGGTRAVRAHARGRMCGGRIGLVGWCARDQKGCYARGTPCHGRLSKCGLRITFGMPRATQERVRPGRPRLTFPARTPAREHRKLVRGRGQAIATGFPEASVLRNTNPLSRKTVSVRLSRAKFVLESEPLKRRGRAHLPCGRAWTTRTARAGVPLRAASTAPSAARGWEHLSGSPQRDPRRRRTARTHTGVCVSPQARCSRSIGTRTMAIGWTWKQGKPGRPLALRASSLEDERPGPLARSSVRSITGSETKYLWGRLQQTSQSHGWSWRRRCGGGAGSARVGG